MATLDELSDALQNAHAAGDTDAARQLADAIVQLRQSPAPDAQAQDAKSTVNDFTTSMVPAAAYGIATGVPGGKALAAGARTLVEKGVEALGGDKAKSYGENRKDIEAEATAAFKKHPLISGGATLAEGLALGKAIPAAAPELVAGKTLANAGQLAKAGAIAGGTYGGVSGAIEGAAPGITEGNPVEAVTGAGKQALKEGVLGAVGGMVAGPVLGAAVDVAAPAIKQVAARVAARAPVVAAPMVRSNTSLSAKIAGQTSPIDNSIAVLSRKLNMSPTDLKARVQDFVDKTGQMPRLGQVLDIATQREVRDIGAAKAAAGDVLNTAQQADEAALSPAITKAVEAGGPTASPETVTAARNKAMDAAMGPLADKRVPLTKDNLDLLNDPDVTEALPRSLRKKFAEAHTAMGKGADELSQNISLRDLESARYALSQRAGAGEKHKFGELANEVRDIASAEVPEYGTALKQFGEQSEVAKGVEQGRAALSSNDTQSFTDTAKLASAKGQEGQALGARTALADQAKESPAQAARVAQRVTSDTGVQERLGAVLPATEVSRLQGNVGARLKGSEALANMAPSSQRSKSAETAKEVGDTLKSVLIAGSHSTTLFKSEMLSRLVTQLHVTDATARKLAEAITDPNRTQDVISLLKKARVNEQDVRDMVAQSAKVAGVTSGEAAQAVGR